MKIEDKNTVAIYATIKAVSFNELKGSAMVSFSDSELSFEFRNGKKKRAEMVKKMKLEPGEGVLVIGAKTEASPLSFIGWEIKRNGYVGNGEYCIATGTIEQAESCYSYNLLHLEGTRASIKTLDTFHFGQKILCFCFKDGSLECEAKCQNWRVGKCADCPENEKNRVFTAVEWRNL